MSAGSRIVGYPRPADAPTCLLNDVVQSDTDGGIAGPVSSATTDCWLASDIPSITCGNPAVLGEYNCLLAWGNSEW